MRDHGIVDVAVIGGGINGSGIARDAAGRGLKVLLCEKGDLGEGTSSRSGKLIHGGLRYLEYFEFRLVREALIEREVLLAAAPHIVWPMRFVLPHSPEQRPAWMIRAGLFLYDHLGGRQTLAGCRRIALRSSLEGGPLRDDYTLAFEYSDCWVDDARLVVLNALDAALLGAIILPRTQARRARRVDGHWELEMQGADGQPHRVAAAALVNAAGPWVDELATRVIGRNKPSRVRLVKGSHIVVPRFWKGQHAYLLQNVDKRVIFVNPYEDDLCLIGTTDTPLDGPPDAVATDQGEIDYLLEAVNRYMKVSLTREQIKHSFSGVRPLFDDKSAHASAVTRDYVLDVEAVAGKAPLLSIFGGKITTFRKLAEHALEKLAPFLPPSKPSWTARAKLPGGDLWGADFETFAADLGKKFGFLPPRLSRHYARLYGTRAVGLLDKARTMEDLGLFFGGLLYEREAQFLRDTEWAVTAQDILERRTKHGLHLDAAQRHEFAEWVAKS